MQKKSIITSLFIFLVLITSCKTTKDLKSEYKYTADNYSRTIHERDTIFIEKAVFIHDTINTERIADKNTAIEFIDGGGVYNISSGEITGVKRINTTERERSLENKITTLTKQLEKSEGRLSEIQDSVKVVRSSGTEHIKAETKMQNYWWVWLIIGFVVGAGSLIALKKIPYTKPFMMWL